jgi:hypothetical protein
MSALRGIGRVEMGEEEQARVVLRRWQSLAAEASTSLELRALGPRPISSLTSATALQWLAWSLGCVEEPRHVSLHLKAKLCLIGGTDGDHRIPYKSLWRQVEDGSTLTLLIRTEEDGSVLWQLWPSSPEVAKELAAEMKERVAEEDEEFDASAFEALILGQEAGRTLDCWTQETLEEALDVAGEAGTACLCLLKGASLRLISSAGGGECLLRRPLKQLLAVCQAGRRLALVFVSDNSFTSTEAVLLQASDEAAVMALLSQNKDSFHPRSLTCFCFG